MNGELLEIQGRQKSGKTETIHLAWDRLLEHSEVQVEMVERGQGRREIKGGILNIDGVLVDFMSKSEPAEYLLRMLQWLVDAGCQVIVCATHGPRSKSARLVYDFWQNRGWQRKVIEKDQDIYDDEEVAERIVAGVLAAVECVQQLVGV